MQGVRLIDAIELVRYLCGACPSNHNGECIDKICRKYEDRARIENAPTIETEVRRGRWVVRGQDIYCSECNEEGLYNPFGASKFSHFCPNFGAKMDADEKPAEKPAENENGGEENAGSLG